MPPPRRPKDTVNTLFANTPSPFGNSSSVFGSSLQSVFAGNDTQAKETDRLPAPQKPLALFRHANKLKPLELEPYAYISEEHNVPINADCLLCLRTPTNQVSFGVRTLKCVCPPSSAGALTCETSTPVGISPLLYGTAKCRLGSLEDVAVRLEKIDVSQVPAAKHVVVRVVDLADSHMIVDDDVPQYTIDNLRRLKNAISILKCHFIPTMVYSVGQIYAFTIGGQLLLLSVDHFTSKASFEKSPHLFRVADQAFHLEIGGPDPSLKSGPANKLAQLPQRAGFRHVGGLKDIKKALETAIIVPLIHPDLYFDSAGSLKGIRPPKGVLLHGIPGTGKTFLTRAVAEEITNRWNSEQTHWKPPHVQNVSSSAILKGDVSELTGLFELAKSRFENERRQTLLIFDELDALCPTREEASAQSIELTTILLTHLDGADASPGTVVIGTTNRPEALDAAVRRPGRLDQEFEMDVPNLEDRAEMILKCAQRHHIEDVINTKEVAQRLAANAHGFVPSDIDAWFVRAFQIAQQEYLESGDFSKDIAVNLDHFQQALVFIRPSGLKDFALEIPKVSWNDIGGYEEIKNSLKECIEWPLKYSHLFTQMGLSAPRGLLLYGPPGNSKTILAKAVASEAKMNFISVKGPEIFSKWVGESEKTIRTIFRKARQHAPTIIFFDEIDALGTDRQGKAKGGSGVEARVLSQMLNEMDGIGASKQVIIIGATNRPDLLDAALLRPGRFDRLLYVSLPDSAARQKIFDIHLRNVAIEDRHEVLLSLTERSAGFSGAEIAMICTETRMEAAKKLILDGHTSVVGDIKLTQSDFDQILAQTKPRTSQDLIDFYERYRRGRK